MKVSSQIKKFVRNTRKNHFFMLHHVTDGLNNDCTKSSRVLSIENFLKLCDKYVFEDIKIKTKGNFLTFDDGLADFYNTVFPIISERQIPVILFVCVNLIDTPGYISKNQLLKIAESPLVTIGSHCVNHIPLKKINVKEKESEVKESKKYLEELINSEIDYIAYPFGQYDLQTLKITHRCGYKKGFAAAEFELPAICYRNLRLPRIDITNERIKQWL